MKKLKKRKTKLRNAIHVELSTSHLQTKLGTDYAFNAEFGIDLRSRTRLMVIGQF
jgi:hypothetical protein